MPYLGESAALLTALCWSISIVMFRQLGGNFTPLNLNFWKGLISIGGIGLLLLLNPATATIGKSNLGWLLLSGLIGIGVGDTAFFAALNRMGERATLLLSETMAPVFTALLAMVWINEWLSWRQWLAIAVILLGVDLVVRARKGRRKNIEMTLSGFNFAALAAISQAVGAVIGRDILVSGEVDSTGASFYRLIGGMLLIVPWLALSRHSWLPKAYSQMRTWRIMAMATFFGTFIAMMMQMFAFAHAEAAIVQSLFAASIIFSLIIAAWQGQAISRTAWLGSSVAVAGVIAIFLV